MVVGHRELQKQLVKTSLLKGLIILDVTVFLLHSFLFVNDTSISARSIFPSCQVQGLLAEVNPSAFMDN